MVGIAGPSCSGKTELALLLERELGATRIPLDHYYKDLGELDPALREAHNFDHPDALDAELLIEQLQALGASDSIEMPLYHFPTHRRRDERRQIRPGAIVVVEGLFALYFEEVRKLLDLAIYLELDHHTALERRLRRDTLTRGRDAASVRAQYARTVEPMCRRFVEPSREHAGLILSGDRPAADLAREVHARLRETV